MVQDYKEEQEREREGETIWRKSQSCPKEGAKFQAQGQEEEMQEAKCAMWRVAKKKH